MPGDRWSDKIDVIHLSDDPQFTDDLASLDGKAGPGRALVLDLSAVTFLNSSNIARLLRVRKQMIESGSRLVLCGVGTQVWGTFLVTGLDKVFSVADNVAVALAQLQMNAGRDA